MQLTNFSYRFPNFEQAAPVRKRGTYILPITQPACQQRLPCPATAMMQGENAAATRSSRQHLVMQAPETIKAEPEQCKLPAEISAEWTDETSCASQCPVGGIASCLSSHRLRPWSSPSNMISSASAISAAQSSQTTVLFCERWLPPKPQPPASLWLALCAVLGAASHIGVVAGPQTDRQPAALRTLQA